MHVAKMTSRQAGTTRSRVYRYPRNWGQLMEALRDGRPPSDFGLKGSRGDIVRFGSRFRLAAAFRGLELDGYNTSTTGGYAALMRVFLCWSAFEQLMTILGLRQKDLDAFLAPYAPDRIAKVVKRTDKKEAFFQFVRSKVDKRHAKALDDYFQHNLTNVTFLASAIRHIFVHGFLTPHSNDVKPGNVESVCSVVSEFLLDVMSRAFAERVDVALGKVPRFAIGGAST